MRLLYLTAHLADVDVVQHALARHDPPVQVDPCATARQVLDRCDTPGAAVDGILVDTAPPLADPLKAIADIRRHRPDAAIVALVRPGADTLAAEALVAGADDTLVKHGAFYLLAPGLVEDIRRRRAGQTAHAAPVFRVLLVGTADPPAGLDPARVEVVRATPDWWSAPAERTVRARPDVIVIDDPPALPAVAGALKALRDAQVPAPVIIVSAAPGPEIAAAWQRLGVAATVPAEDPGRLAEVIDRAATVSRLAADVASLRARERRLRAIVESVPAAVLLVQRDGAILAVNFAGLALLGAASAAEVVGRRLEAFCDPSATAEVDAFLARVCEGTPGLVRFPGRTLDGASRLFDLRAVPLRRDEDTTAALGVMRIAPAVDAEATTPASAGSEVEIPLDPLAEPSVDEQAALAEVEALRGMLEAEQQALAEARGRLDEAAVREAVSEAAWAAVQSELQRKLLLQGAEAATAHEHEVTRALLERSLREKDARLLAAIEDRNRALSRLHRAEKERDAAHDAVADRDAEIARLREALEDALAAKAAAVETIRQHEARLAALEAEAEEDAATHAGLADDVRGLREALAAATAERDQHAAMLAARDAALAELRADRDRLAQALDAATAELERLRSDLETRTRDEAALVDVRQQVARLQAAAATVEEQQRALDEARDQLDRLRAALEDALGTRTELEGLLRQREASLAETVGDRDRLAAEVEALRERATEAERQLADVRAVLARVEAEREAIVAERGATAHDLAGFRQALETAEAELAGARVRLEGQAGEIASLRDALAEARRRTSDLEAALADRAREIDGLRQEVEAWRARYEGARIELEALVPELDEARRQLTDAAQLAPALATLQASHDRMAEQLARAREQLAAVEDQLREADTWREALDRADRDRAALVEARAAAEAQAADLRARVADLEASLRDAVTRAETTAVELAHLQTARNDLQAALAETRAAHEHARQRAAEAEAVVHELRAALAERETALGTMRVSFEALAAERDTLRQALAAAADTRSQDTARIEDLRTRLADLDTRVSALQAERDAAWAERDELRRAVEQVTRERDDLAARLAAVEATRQGLLADQQALQQQVVALEERLAAQRRGAADLETDRDALREALARADASAQMLASRQAEQIDALTASLEDLRARLARSEARWQEERAALERALATRAQAYDRLAHSEIVGLATTTPTGALLRANDTLAGLLGYAHASDLLAREQAATLPLVTDWTTFAREIDAAGGTVTVEACIQRPDGRVAWLVASATMMADPASGSARVEWTVIDATDRYLRLRQQQQARRLEAVRELAVSAGREVLDTLARPGAAAAAGVPTVADEPRVARVREIAEQLVTFAQRQARLTHLVDLTEAIAHLRPVLLRLVGEDLSLAIELPPSPVVVSVDPAELDQWVTSLTVAVRDAMPPVGTLVVSVRTVDLAVTPGARRRQLSPMALIAWRAGGLGLRGPSVPASIADAVAQRGGLVRATHEALAASAGVELLLPAVIPTAGREAAFPLLRSVGPQPGP